ncbi:MAG TPA: hypothetical protein ACFCUY_18425 [Xenococcaceae cyanobacterium]
MSQSNHFSHFTDYSLSSIINNSKQIFELIDSVVALESCLHYQFLPLALKDNILIVGMINSEARNGCDFVYSKATALGYSLEIVNLDSQTHQLVIAAYLKRDLTGVKESNITKPSNSSQSSSPKNAAVKLDYSLTLTDIPDTPQNSDSAFSEPSTANLDYSLTLTDVPVAPSNNQAANLHERPTLIVDSPQKSLPNQSNLPKDAVNISQPQIFTSEPNITSSDAVKFNPNQPESSSNLLEVKAKYINESVDTLSSLAPQQLWQELLARILEGGIGRLYLERHPYHGRILWSRDGVVQSSLDRVEISVFNHIIQEIKILGKQPLTPVEKAKKVATEKFYNQERILLRIEYFLNQYGEEITIQILRGKALKFYEQRQIKRMMEQAVTLSQKLEKVLKKIVFCSRSGELDDLNSLKTVYNQIEKHIKLLEKQAKNSPRNHPRGY